MAKYTISRLLNGIILMLVLVLGNCVLSDVEKQFIEVPSPREARASLKHITSKPHVAGSQGDLEVRSGLRSTNLV